ncbi:O-antigen ligase [Marinobacter nauticus]|uniref:O-antigen ligase n=1 Tax=Marinobacter nauticus TaxID=2743 RepID=A0A368XW43_MARNT|nr:O-antigen ligase family protein [Marinobacter nauticus]MCG8524712.1 O-antigen ligase family protein [Pseudomonadales bacterium]RCW72193.1 O-antigen ligase [Marinobacter nauticus]
MASVISNAKAAAGMAPGDRSPASSFSFGIYIFFLIDFFLHLSARFPAYGVIRPTLVLVLIISLSLFLQRERFKGWTKDPIVYSLGVLLIYIIVSLPLVEWPGSVIKNNLGDFVKAVVFFYFTVLLVDTEKRLKILFFVFVLCQVLRVFEPLFLNLTEGYWGSSTHLGHGEFSQRLAGAPSDVINPNELGFVIVTAIPFLHYILWSWNLKARLLYIVILPPLMYALILTQSRGAFVALLVIGFFIFKESKRKMMLIVVTIAIALLGWQVMNDEQKDRYLSLVGKSETSNAASVDGRIQGMFREFSLGLERPIVGHGLGTTPEAKTHILGSRQASHNLYAELLIELGFVGAFIFISFLVKVYRRLVDSSKTILTSRGENNTFYMNLNKALIAVFWMYAAYSFNYWGLSQYYWYFFAGSVVVFYRMINLHEPSGLLQEESSRPANRFSNLVDVPQKR